MSKPWHDRHRFFGDLCRHHKDCVGEGTVELLAVLTSIQDSTSTAEH
jgi:hypothetical protein